MRKHRWKILATVAGGVAGFAYSYYVGCLTGTCPITSNPWISTAYGAFVGWLAGPAVPTQRKDAS